MAGGMQKNGNASKITLIRESAVYLIDFSTVEGYFKTNQIVKAGDIVYVEPIKRVISDNSTTVALLLSTVTTVTALLVLFTR